MREHIGNLSSRPSRHVTHRAAPRRRAPCRVVAVTNGRPTTETGRSPFESFIIRPQPQNTFHANASIRPLNTNSQPLFTIVSHVGLFFQRNHLGYNNFVAFQSRTKTVLCQNVLQPQSNRFICRNWQTVCNDAELQNMALCMHERGTGIQIDLN